MTRALRCLPLLIACRAAAPVTSPEGAAAPSDPDRCEAAVAAVEAGGPPSLSDARACHAAADTSGDPAAIRAMATAADALYAAWIAQNPDALERAEALYNHGELLYALRRSPEAWARYLQVAVEHPMSRHARFCLESAVYAARESAAAADGARRVEWIARQIEAIDLYVARYPTDPAAPAMAYEAAWLLHDSGLYDEARPRFFRLIVKDPGAPSSEEAAVLILDQLAQSEDWVTLTSTTMALQTISGLGSEAFQQDLARIAALAAERAAQ